MSELLNTSKLTFQTLSSEEQKINFVERQKNKVYKIID
jgi:hypothetical protein